jgi:hypothetical protein
VCVGGGGSAIKIGQPNKLDIINLYQVLSVV